MRKKKIKILHVAQAAGGVDRYIRMLLKYLDTPQHPFAADHDPPADPGYVDTWYLPQRLYLR